MQVTVSRALILGIVIVAGCSSVRSATFDADNDKGLRYFLPRQDFLVAVTVTELEKDKDGETAASSSGDAIPRQAYSAGEGKGDKDKVGNGDETGDHKSNKEKEGADAGKGVGSEPAPEAVPEGSSKNYRVRVTATTPYPDMANSYWLKYGTNWLGTNTLNIAVSPEGLLRSTNSTTSPGVSEIFKDIARAAGMVRPMGYFPGEERKIDACDAGEVGTYVYRIEVPHEGSIAEKHFCGMTATFTSLDNSSDSNMSNPLDCSNTGQTRGGSSTDDESKREVSGIYYRQSIPYFVQIRGKGIHMEGLVSSPSQSPTYLLPAKSTFFAKNNAEFGLKDGMPTLYNQSSDGEIVGLVKLPANILGAYFGAIGEMFGKITSNETAQATLIQAQLGLEYTRFRQEQCLAAIAASDTALVEAMCAAPAPSNATKGQ